MGNHYAEVLVVEESGICVQLHKVSISQLFCNHIHGRDWGTGVALVESSLPRFQVGSS
jgi:hypothetical protein